MALPRHAGPWPGGVERGDGLAASRWATAPSNAETAPTNASNDTNMAGEADADTSMADASTDNNIMGGEADPDTTTEDSAANTAAATILDGVVVKVVNEMSEGAKGLKASRWA